MKMIIYNDRDELMLQTGNLGKSLLERLDGNGKVVQEYYDLLYELYYTGFEPDLIVINRDGGICSEETDWDRRLTKASCFPVELGEICKEICKEKVKREPKILIITAHCKEFEEFSQGKAEMVDTMSYNFLDDIQRIIRNLAI